MSGLDYILYRERALEMLEAAERMLEDGKYDVAALLSEYSAQLYVKALINRLEGGEVRGHGIRTLLGHLTSLLQEQGYPELSATIVEFTRRHRRALIELEEAHVRSVYSPLRYTREQAKIIIEAARTLIGMLRSLERDMEGKSS